MCIAYLITKDQEKTAYNTSFLGIKLKVKSKKGTEITKMLMEEMNWYPVFSRLCKQFLKRNAMNATNGTVGGKMVTEESKV